MPNSGYWSATRAPRYSLTFALPLLLAYEVLARVLSGESGIRNGADVLLKSLFVLLGGRHGLTVFGILLFGTGLFLVVRDWRLNGPPRGRFFLGMTLESGVYAFLFGGVTSVLTALLLQGPTVETIISEAGRLPASLIVLGSHGHGRIYDVLVGSVSEGIVRASKVPVLLVPARRGT